MSADGDSDTQSEQLADITQSIVALANMDFARTPSIRGNGALDAVAAGLIALDEELQESVVAREEAEQANEAKIQFLANMNHEFRTPLTTILGSVELLREMELDSAQRSVLQRVESAGNLLHRLVVDLLDVSSIEAGTLRIKSEAFKVNDVIVRVTNTFSNLAKQKGLGFYNERVGFGDNDVVMGDADRLEQVLNNLLENALKYTSEGQVLISSQLRNEDSFLVLTVVVEDTGLGISVEEQGQIFEQFTIGDSSFKRRNSGAGLGLSISRGLMQSMGGSIGVESQLGKGSRFTIELKMPVATIEITGSQDPDEYLKTQFVGCHVLVVDDTEILQMVAKEMLQLLGCTVEVASTGMKALELVAAHDFNLILMDCQMPLMDGLETTSRLLESHPERDLRIVAISAYTSHQDRLNSLEAGMVSHLEKPFNLQELSSTVRDWASAFDGD